MTVFDDNVRDGEHELMGRKVKTVKEWQAVVSEQIRLAELNLYAQVEAARRVAEEKEATENHQTDDRARKSRKRFKTGRKNSRVVVPSAIPLITATTAVNVQAIEQDILALKTAAKALEGLPPTATIASGLNPNEIRMAAAAAQTEVQRQAAEEEAAKRRREAEQRAKAEKAAEAKKDPVWTMAKVAMVAAVSVAALRTATPYQPKHSLAALLFKSV